MWKTCLEKQKIPSKGDLVLGNDLDNGADVGPVINYFGIGVAHIDAAVAHGGAKIIVPVGAMNAIIAIEVHGVFDAW